MLKHGVHFGEFSVEHILKTNCIGGWIMAHTFHRYFYWTWWKVNRPHFGGLFEIGGFHWCWGLGKRGTKTSLHSNFSHSKPLKDREGKTTSTSFLSHWSPEAACLLMLLTILLYRGIGVIQAKLFTNANYLKCRAKLALKLTCFVGFATIWMKPRPFKKAIRLFRKRENLLVSNAWYLRELTNYYYY